MLAPVNAVEVDEPPVPPPWLGVRRLAGMLVAAALLCAVLWILWWQIAEARLRPKLAAMAASGEPATLAEFPRPVVADADNAATYWLKAISGVSAVDCPASSNFTYPNAPPYPKQWFDLESAAVVADEPAIKLAVEASRHRQVDWGPPPPSPYFLNRNFGRLNSYRNLANHLGDAALWSHFHQDDKTAIARVNALFDFADDVAADHPSLIGHLVSVGIRALGLFRLQIIAGNLQLQEDVAGGAPRAEIEQLIQRLSDPRNITVATSRALMGERAYIVDSLQWAGHQQPVLRPMFDLEIGQVLELSNLWQRTATASSRPAAAAIFTHLPQLGTHTAFLNSYTNVTFRSFEIGWRVTAEQRMTAVVLALHLYEHDHGRWPKSLRELVPTYLKALPTDPYAADGRPVGYIVVTAPNLPVARPMLFVDSDPAKPPTPLPPQASLGWSGNDSRQWRDVAAWQVPEAERHLKLPMTTQP